MNGTMYIHRCRILGAQKNVTFLIKKKRTFSFLSFSIAIGPILIIFDVLKSSWMELLYCITFVYASAIVADCCVITTDCFVMTSDGCEILTLKRSLSDLRSTGNGPNHAE